jgi:phosphoglycolate phosphatase
MPPLIVFDLDGTLIDSRLDLAESANELLVSLGAGPLPVDAIAGMIGEGARVLVSRVLKAAGMGADPQALLARFLEIYDRRLTNHTRLYPGLESALASVAGRSALALLTNKPKHHTRRLLEAFGVASRFRWVIGGDSGFPRKPDPASLQYLIGEAGTTPETTLFVGDSMVDVETARRAGVRVCVAAYGFAQFREGIALAGDEFVARAPGEVTACLNAFLENVVATRKPT